MSPESQRLVRESWAALQPMGDRVIHNFYDRLLDASPDAARLFAATDMVEQRRKFGAMLGEILRVLDVPELLVGEVAESGRRHVGYGVRDRDYDDVGAALLWALERQLGDRFTLATRQAWREAYTLLAAVMRRSARASGGYTASP